MKKLKLMTILGTRPEIIRLSAVIRTADRYFDHILVHTGQNYDPNLNDIFFKFGLNVSDDEIPRIQALLHERLGDIMVPVTTGHGSIDLIIPGVHKANGLRILQARWGIENSDVVAFGDSGNDVEMLRQSGFSFAMANAKPHIKAVARFEAQHNNDEGVLNVIEKVLNGEAPFN